MEISFLQFQRYLSERRSIFSLPSDNIFALTLFFLAVESGCQVDVCYTGFSKPLDKISYDKLIQKVESHDNKRRSPFIFGTLTAKAVSMLDWILLILTLLRQRMFRLSYSRRMKFKNNR